LLVCNAAFLFFNFHCIISVLQDIMVLLLTYHYVLHRDKDNLDLQQGLQALESYKADIIYLTVHYSLWSLIASLSYATV